MTEIASLRLAGAAGMLGAALYVAGDILLLAPMAAAHRERRPFPIDLTGDRLLRRRIKVFEDMAMLPSWRLRWGALLGVVGAPLTLAGIWLLYRGLEVASASFTFIPVTLFLVASVVGPFVHGSFCYIGETVQALFAVGESDRPLLLAMLRRQIVTVMISYAPLMLAVIAASGWVSVVVISGRTRFPTWLAAINPVTMTIAWLLVKRVLPRPVGEFFQGAGFNIAYIAWFAAMTTTIR